MTKAPPDILITTPESLYLLLTSAARAISCAVAMQQGTERANYNSAHPIGLRTGLSGGDVIRDEGDCFGDPVVEASRLCARCVGGQVLAAEIVSSPPTTIGGNMSSR